MIGIILTLIVIIVTIQHTMLGTVLLAIGTYSLFCSDDDGGGKLKEIEFPALTLYTREESLALFQASPAFLGKDAELPVFQQSGVTTEQTANNVEVFIYTALTLATACAAGVEFGHFKILLIPIAVFLFFGALLKTGGMKIPSAYSCIYGASVAFCAYYFESLGIMSLLPIMLFFPAKSGE